MPTSKPGVDLSPVGDKGFQGSCSAGLAAEVIPPAAAHSLVSDHTFSAEVHRGVFVFLMAVEMLENSAVSMGLWHFSTRAKSSYGTGHHSVLWTSLLKNLYLLQDHFVEMRGKPRDLLGLDPSVVPQTHCELIRNLSAVFYCLKIHLCCSLGCRNGGGESWASF